MANPPARPHRDPVLVAMFKESGQGYEEGVRELGAKIQASLTAKLAAQQAGPRRRRPRPTPPPTADGSAA